MRIHIVVAVGLFLNLLGLSSSQAEDIKRDGITVRYQFVTSYGVFTGISWNWTYDASDPEELKAIYELMKERPFLVRSFSRFPGRKKQIAQLSRKLLEELKSEGLLQSTENLRVDATLKLFDYSPSVNEPFHQIEVAMEVSPRDPIALRGTLGGSFNETYNSDEQILQALKQPFIRRYCHLQDYSKAMNQLALKYCTK